MSDSYRARLRKKRLEQGLCGRCGQLPVSGGTTLCTKCRRYYKKRWKNRTPKQIEIHRNAVKNWSKNNPEKRKASYKKYHDKLKRDVIEHYGGICTCCGETNMAFLTIDHIDGGGNVHRRKLFGKNVSGNAFYRKMRQMEYPSGLQVLCWNCNMAKAHYGACPHKMGHADRVATINIAARADLVNRPIVACDETEAVKGIEVEHSYKLLTSVME